MGGPLSPLVAEIFVTHLEETILHSKATHVRSWYRFVDDVLCIWRGPRSDLEVFLEHLNRFHPAISFTMDFGGGKISYLHLNIKLEEQDNVLKTSFSIYRKPSFTDVSVHSQSFHPQFQKWVAVNSAIHRLISIPMEQEAFESEIGKIEQIAQINGLTINIRRLIRRRKLRKLLSFNGSNPTPTTGRKRERWIRFPYQGITSGKVATELKKYG